ncbi:uncharacterized protein [Chaetodon trifascialis]|uniref:uncharacterized protein n=1 Tax=Chaetodon trifascialis TaxID=109706 RepID=UPI003990FBE5
MMETKLWVALCALLLVNLASADRDNDHTAASNASRSGDSEAPAAPDSGLDPINQAVPTPSPNGPDTNSSSAVASSLGNDTATDGKTISPTPEPKKDNGTNIVSPSEAAGPEKNLTDPSTSQLPVPPSESHDPTSHTSLNSTAISPTDAAGTASADITPAITPPSNTTHHAAFPLPDTPSNQTTHPQTHSVTSVPTPEPETIAVTNVTQSSSTSSTSSPQELPSSESPALTSPQTTSQPGGHPETSTGTHHKSTTSPQSSPSAQAKPHADTPSQLNVGGDTTMVHESPTLDPLLAGLVSAFIITAVIITLLLFLKLRRRDSRPEFRRLQDLPMDDMMEDTPLSMYSY